MNEYPKTYTTHGGGGGNPRWYVHEWMPATQSTSPYWAPTRPLGSYGTLEHLLREHPEAMDRTRWETHLNTREGGWNLSPTERLLYGFDKPEGHWSQDDETPVDFNQLSRAGKIVRLAAIPAPNDQGSIVVRIPTPSPVGQAPAAPQANTAPPKQANATSRGPVFILPG